jgi:serine/threonine protein kinase
VHRDLKPANIMLTSIEGDRDFVKVLDFGVARLLDPKTTDLTSVGLPDGERELIGTPRYMSPEQVRGEGLSGASDIYSLGLILYEMLTGEPAVQGESTMALITQQISPEPLRLQRLGNIDPMLQDITRIAVAKNLSDRWQSAEQIVDALEQYLHSMRAARTTMGASGEFANFQSQLLEIPQSGWQPSAASWSGTPSGNWMQSGYFEQQQPPQNSGYQQGYPPPTGQHPSGQYPNQPPVHPTGQHPGVRSTGQHPAMQPQAINPYQTVPPGYAPSGQFPQAQPQNHPGYGHPSMSGQQPIMGNPRATMPPTAGPFVELPNVHGERFEIQLDRNAEFEDFQATVEHASLDRAQLRRSIVAGSFSELPPPPEDAPPFQDPAEIAPAREAAVATKRPVNPNEDLTGFTLSIVKVVVLSFALMTTVYIAFIILGAALAPHVAQATRLMAAAMLGFAPTVAAFLLDTGPRERFAVITRPIDRAIRVLASGAVFNLGVILLVSAVGTHTVVSELRKDPSWFLASQDTKLASVNRSVSYSVADFIATTMGALGLHEPRRAAPVNAPPGPTRTPAPTRTGTPKSAEPAEKTPAEDNRGSAPKDKSGYVNW